MKSKFTQEEIDRLRQINSDKINFTPQELREYVRLSIEDYKKCTS